MENLQEKLSKMNLIDIQVFSLKDPWIKKLFEIDCRSIHFFTQDIKRFHQDILSARKFHLLPTLKIIVSHKLKWITDIELKLQYGNNHPDWITQIQESYKNTRHELMTVFNQLLIDDIQKLVENKKKNS